MDHNDMEDDTRMSGEDSRLNDMDDDMNGSGGGGGSGGGHDSPLRPSPGGDAGEDILAKLRQQVSMASHGPGSPPMPTLPSMHHVPLHHNNYSNGQELIYHRLNAFLQAKLKRDDTEDDHGMCIDDTLALRAEALQRQRESLIASPQALIANAVRSGLPPSLVPPAAHLPLLPGSMNLPSTTQLPPTPGSAGSRDSSGNGSRTPSHTPEPANQNWSFEDQFKQSQEPSKHSSFEEDKRKLYELSDDGKRREFLDDLFSFMQQRGTPINRLPIMAKQVLDLYELYNLVVSRGGLVDVINKKLWQEIIKGLKLPSSITSAAFTLRTQYMKYIYPFECEKNKLSNPQELQVAIDGNRREGRRSSYAGGYSDLSQPGLMNFPNLHSFGGLQRLHAPLSLVSRPQLNGNGVPGHPLVPQDLLRGNGGGGSPPGMASQAMADARLNLWKIYNHGLGAGGPGVPGGLMGNSLGAGMLSSPHEEDRGLHNNPSHHPLLPPHPPQREALNLDVKDEFDLCPRSSKKDSPGSEEESNGLPPAAKRLHEDDQPPSRDLPPTPTSAGSLPGNIEINSHPLGDSNRNSNGNHRDGNHRDGNHRDGNHRDGNHREDNHRGGNHRDGNHRDGNHREHLSYQQNGGQSLSINMEINGIQYKGVLWPQHPSSSPPRSQHHNNPLVSNSSLLPQLSGSPLVPSPGSPIGLSLPRFR